MALAPLRDLQGRCRDWRSTPSAVDSPAVVIESERGPRSVAEPRPQSAASADAAFRLQANMRRGTGSSLRGTWSSYASLDNAREAAHEMLRDDRVARVTVVTDTLPQRFVEWVNR